MAAVALGPNAATVRTDDALGIVNPMAVPLYRTSSLPEALEHVRQLSAGELGPRIGDLYSPPDLAAMPPRRWPVGGCDCERVPDQDGETWMMRSRSPRTGGKSTPRSR